MNHISQRRKWRVAPVMTLGLALLLTGCEGLLEVDLPGTVQGSQLDDPALSEVLVNSAITALECAYSRFVAGVGAGHSDVFFDDDDDMPFEYQTFPSGGNTCDSGGDDGVNFFDPMHHARFLGEDTYRKITQVWDLADVELALDNFETVDQMLGVAALYAAFAYDVFGEHFCEMTFDISDIISPDSTLQRAESWADSAIMRLEAHVAGGGDVEPPYSFSDDAVEISPALRSTSESSGCFSSAL